MASHSTSFNKIETTCGKKDRMMEKKCEDDKKNSKGGKKYLFYTAGSKVTNVRKTSPFFNYFFFLRHVEIYEIIGYKASTVY